MAELCAVVYVWQLDDLRRQYDTAYLGVIVGGQPDPPLPTWSDVRDDFEVALHAVPKKSAESDESVILRGLGLR